MKKMFKLIVISHQHIFMLLSGRPASISNIWYKGLTQQGVQRRTILVVVIVFEILKLLFLALMLIKVT